MLPELVQMHQFTPIWVLLSVSAAANQLLSVPEAPQGSLGGPQPGDAGAGLYHNPLPAAGLEEAEFPLGREVLPSS